MLILDRYVLRPFLRSYLTALFVFILLYVVIDVFSNLQDVLRNHPPLIKVLEFYLYSVPTIASQTSPVASLLATLVTLGTFNQANEIIAMRSTGLSVYQIIRPLIVAGILLSLGIFMLNETVTPRAQKTSKMIKEYFIEKLPENPRGESIENVAVYGFNNRLFFINKLYPKANMIEGLTILEQDADQNVRSKIYAEKAVWRNNRWILYQCFIYHTDDDKRIRGEPLYFTDTTIKIEETPQDFLRQNIAVENMNIRELSSYISRLSQNQESSAVKKLKVDLYQKTSLPFTNFIIILLGIPTSIAIRRRAVAFSSIGLCIGISFIFYVVFAVSIALGKGGALPPIAAAWSSHVLFGVSALVLIIRIP